MRTSLMTLLCVACLVQPPPKATDDQAATTPSTADRPPNKAQARDAKTRPEPRPAPDPILPPPPPAGLKGVDVVGHGLRITMYPPFQVSLADDFTSHFVEKEGSGGLILSWWNLADEKAGGRTGFGGLYNAGTAVHPAPAGATIVRSEREWPNGKKGIAYRLGETGSYVLLPPELLDAGGMLTVTPGPADVPWSMEVDGVRTPLETGKIVHSADPEAGPPFVLDGRPHKPWGLWKDKD